MSHARLSRCLSNPPFSVAENAATAAFARGSVAHELKQLEGTEEGPWTWVWTPRIVALYPYSRIDIGIPSVARPSVYAHCAEVLRGSLSDKQVQMNPGAAIPVTRSE